MEGTRWQQEPTLRPAKGKGREKQGEGAPPHTDGTPKAHTHRRLVGGWSCEGAGGCGRDLLRADRHSIGTLRRALPAAHPDRDRNCEDDGDGDHRSCRLQRGRGV